MPEYVLTDPTLPIGLGDLGTYPDIIAANVAAFQYALKHAPMEFHSGVEWAHAVQIIQNRLRIEPKDNAPGAIVP